MKKILGFLATGFLALAASNASAIPLQVNVTSGGVGGASGSWELDGPTSESANWGGILFNAQSWNLDIVAGDYQWTITGAGFGFPAGATWSLYLAGNQVFAGSGGGFGHFTIYDDYSFTTSVPEPGTLGLLGLGLWAVGFAATRRRRIGRGSDQLV